MKQKTIICDANILIDYYSAGVALLSSACSYAEIIVPDVVLAEVRQLEYETLDRMGITIVEISLDMLEKANGLLPGCSIQDAVCFMLASEYRWICATNDGKLRRECLNNGVETVRGFRLLADMVEAECMTKHAAVKAARKMAAINRELTVTILQEFYDILEGEKRN